MGFRKFFSHFIWEKNLKAWNNMEKKHGNPFAFKKKNQCKYKKTDSKEFKDTSIILK